MLVLLFFELQSNQRSSAFDCLGRLFSGGPLRTVWTARGTPILHPQNPRTEQERREQAPAASSAWGRVSSQGQLALQAVALGFWDSEVGDKALFTDPLVARILRLGDAQGSL